MKKVKMFFRYDCRFGKKHTVAELNEDVLHLADGMGAVRYDEARHSKLVKSKAEEKNKKDKKSDKDKDSQKTLDEGKTKDENDTDDKKQQEDK